MIAGAAGTGFFLLNLYAARQAKSWLDGARELGDYLEQHAVREDGQAYWPIAPDRETVYLGFSHGAAGIGTFLVHLAGATGEDKWLELAREAAAYVIAHAVDDGPDGWGWAKQPPPVEPDVRLQWCHGSPGVSLFFLALAEATGDPTYDAALGRAVAANLRRGRTARIGGCFCHGKAGNADCLLEVWRVRKDPRLLEAARAWGADLYGGHSVHRKVGERAYGPGFMTGLAGIGHFLLRLADPEETPAAFLVAGGIPDAVLEAVRAANRLALRPGSEADRAIESLASLGPAGFRAACRLIASGEAHWRTYEVLRALYYPGAEAQLLALADGPALPGHGRWTALRGLVAADTPEVRRYLLARIEKERDAGLFMSAAQALGMLAEPRAVAPVAKQLLRFEARWSGVEPHLVSALAGMGEGATKHLLAFVADERATRGPALAGALTALERLDPEAARQAARALAASPRFEGLDDALKGRVERLAR